MPQKHNKLEWPHYTSTPHLKAETQTAGQQCHFVAQVWLKRNIGASEISVVELQGKTTYFQSL